MRSGLLFTVGLLLSASIAAQKPCGTMAYKDPWLTQFQRTLDGNALRSSDTVLYVPITLHILGNDDGIGYFSAGRAMLAFCRLNEDFSESNIQFYLNGDIRYLNSSEWFDHQDIRQGAEMMFANNVDNTINCYVVQDPAGNCGYNLPYAGIALSKSCMGPNDHTWAHEIGHNLSLPHPFLGWEGGQTHDGSMPPVYSQPAPPYVTYDYTLFKDRFYPDTLIIDTALVENVARDNCREAADGFCDTYPDYLAFRWNCGQDSNSQVRQHDPTGESFLSDGRWIMSYSSDQCNAGFSQEQILAMRANLRQEKSGHLSDQTPATELVGMVSNVYPEEDEILSTGTVEFEWSPVQGASHYLLEVSRISSFGFLEVETIVDTTRFIVADLIAGRKYYWRVKPFNRHSFCADYSDRSTFTAGSGVRTRDITNEDMVTVSSLQDRIQIRINEPIFNKFQSLEVYNIVGSKMYDHHTPPGDDGVITLKKPPVSGTYVIVINTDDSIFTLKTIVH